ncbi:MAG TPA: DUF4145 domain-containing protein [Symbiobacteriaceae bacterium]|jgi:hypothetical protein
MTSVVLYPDRKRGHRDAKTFRAVPDNLQGLYEQTITALNQNLDALCAGGLRAIIEGLCADQGVTEGLVPKRNPDRTPVLKTDGSPELVKSKNLEGKIEGLAQKGVLTVPHAHVLHEHRYIGNEALHELKSIDRSALALALDIVEQTFTTVYELPRQQRILERKRKKR